MGIYAFNNFGYEGSIVTVEVDLRRGIPAVDIVGLADGAVKESRERIISAIRNQGFEFPAERVLMSLSPADLRKEGTSFDLPMALAVLRESEEMPKSQDEKVLVMGELELSGNIRPVRGVYAALATARENGIKYAIIPEQTEAVPDGIIVNRVKNLREAFEALCNVDEVEDTANDEEMAELWDNGFGRTYNEADNMNIEFEEVSEEKSLDNIEGMNGLKYAMAVAVAGRHNIMAWGNPGCGKTMTLQRMTQLMPKLTDEERQSVQRIYSIAGLLKPNEKIEHRPFRMPHQTASIEGMCGGGVHVMPGEISLAHNGVLFLDEAAEFRSSVLQMLRVPLECNSITLCRAGHSTVYPASFQLVMAASPCPCGNYGSPDRICLCSLKSIEQYWKKFSSPLLDRVEIRYDCNKEDNSAYISQEDFKGMIAEAWKRQYARQGKLNGRLTAEEIDKYIVLDEYAKIHLNRKAEVDDMTIRRRANVLKLARTIQDMNDGKDKVDDVSLCMALMLNGKTVLENL